MNTGLKQAINCKRVRGRAWERGNVKGEGKRWSWYDSLANFRALVCMSVFRLVADAWRFTATM